MPIAAADAANGNLTVVSLSKPPGGLTFALNKCIKCE